MADQPQTQNLLSVETPESVAFAYRLAGLASRGFALMLDALIITGIGIGEALLAWGIYAIVGLISKPLQAESVSWLIGGLLVVLFASAYAYFLIGEVRGHGQTWGKRWMGLRVVRDDGSRVRFGDSVIRNLIRIVDFLPGNFTVGMVSIMVTRQHKRLGDMAAGTVVVRDDRDELRLDDGAQDRRVLLAREFLDRRGGLASDEARWQVGVAVLETFGEAPQPGWDEPTLAGRIADLSGWRTLRRPDTVHERGQTPHDAFQMAPDPRADEAPGSAD
jgi:uncharacterized RDD family membrane protein YckC